MSVRLAALATVVLLAGPAAAAFGQAAPFAPLPPAQTTPDVTVAPTNSSSSNGGLKTWQEILIFGGGAALLLGIGMVIVSDARRSAPVKAGPESVPGSERRARQRSQQRARARAKAARQQRRRNR